MKNQRVNEVCAQVLAGLNRTALAEIAGAHGTGAVSGADPSKYLDAERWIRVCARRAVALDLDRSAGLRVLDLGTGAGYFPLVCRVLGHLATATDWSGRDGIYPAITAATGVPVTDLDVAPMQPLAIAGSFDLITAYMVTFNGHRTRPWGVDEWAFFLSDCMRRLAPGGRLVLELNAEEDGRCYTPQLAKLFREQGAIITGHWPHTTRVRGHRLVFVS